MTFIGCSSLREGIYIGQQWSIIEITPDDTLIAQDVRVDGNSISAVSGEDSGYIYQIKGRYKLSSDKLFVEVGDSIKLIGTVDEHNIIFGKELPENIWNRWYGGNTRTDYTMYKSRFIRSHVDMILCNLYALALRAVSYKNLQRNEKYKDGTYDGFEKQNLYEFSNDRTMTFSITTLGTSLKLEAHSLLNKGGTVNLILDEYGRITAGPNVSGF